MTLGGTCISGVWANAGAKAERTDAKASSRRDLFITKPPGEIRFQIEKLANLATKLVRDCWAENSKAGGRYDEIRVKSMRGDRRTVNSKQ
jgi:hypothetical protein